MADYNKQPANSAVEKNPAIDRTPEPWETQPCPVCRSVKSSKQCPGHAPGVESGGGGDYVSDQSTQDDAILINKPTPTDNDANPQEDELDDVELFALDELKFNPEVIAYLLSNRMLLIDNNLDLGTLTIRLLCDPNLLSIEQKHELRKFVNEILLVLEKFKNENRIAAKCNLVEQDKDGNILSVRIALPSPTLYEAFILQLSKQNLLPIKNINQQPNEKIIYGAGDNVFNPSPLSMKPAPANSKKLTEDEELEEQKSSFLRPKSPRDGLKPLG